VQAPPECGRNRTGITDERSRLRRLQLNRFIPLLVFSIGVPSLVTTYPNQAASKDATIQGVPITSTASTPGTTTCDATDGTIQ
jgi:hypothetical protein